MVKELLSQRQDLILDLGLIIKEMDLELVKVSLENMRVNGSMIDVKDTEFGQEKMV